MPTPTRTLAALAVLVAAAPALAACDEEPVGRKLTVTWAGSEGVPSCAYDAASRSARALIRIDGTAPHDTTVNVTVTAYADENTSALVGTGARTVVVGGTVRERLTVTIPVDARPHRGEDGETACRLAVDYGEEP